MAKVKTLKEAQQEATSRREEYLRKDAPVRCVRCKGWMRRDPYRTLRAQGTRSTPSRTYLRRMPSPNAGLCEGCFAAKALGLENREDVALLKRAARMFTQAGTHGPGCYIGKASFSPFGNGATKNRHGCTCGRTEVVEALTDQHVIDVKTPGFVTED